MWTSQRDPAPPTMRLTTTLGSQPAQTHLGKAVLCPSLRLVAGIATATPAQWLECRTHTVEPGERGSLSLVSLQPGEGEMDRKAKKEYANRIEMNYLNQACFAI